MISPRVLQEVKFRVPGCPTVVHSALRLRKNFIYCHFISKVTVIQEETEPLPCCYLCRMHMSVGRLKMHKNKARFNKNTQMRWMSQDVAIAARCFEVTVSLTGEEEEERIKGVKVFRYFGRMLDWSDENWPAVPCSIRKAHHVWGRLGKVLRRKSPNPAFSAEFYGVLVQAVIFF